MWLVSFTTCRLGLRNFNCNLVYCLNAVMHIYHLDKHGTWGILCNVDVLQAMKTIWTSGADTGGVLWVLEHPPSAKTTYKNQ